MTSIMIVSYLGILLFVLVGALLTGYSIGRSVRKDEDYYNGMKNANEIHQEELERVTFASMDFDSFGEDK